MNGPALLILAALMVNTALSLLADILNLKSLRPVLPKSFDGWYEPDEYARSQSYLRVNTRFGWIASLFDLFVLLIFWFSGGFAWLDEWVRGLGYTAVPSGLVYIGVLISLKMALDFPFSLYATFVIEARFGFNQTTWRTWLLDKLKGMLLGLLIGVPLLAVVLLFFVHAGNNAWWYCWLVTVGVMLLMHYVAPTWIMPLFNRFSPLPAGELRTAITTYAASIGFRLDNIFVMDGSKRSTKANAFFTGFGKYRRIVLYDTLIEKHSVEELVAVLAHEMGHFKRRHIRKMMLIGIAQAGVMFYILSLFIAYPGLFHAFYVQDVSVYVGLVLFGLLYAPLDMVLGIIVQQLSRRHEYEADRFAVHTAPNRGRALATALKRLSVDSLANLQPHPFYVFLNYSHPPVLERIRAIGAAISPE